MRIRVIAHAACVNHLTYAWCLIPYPCACSNRPFANRHMMGKSMERSRLQTEAEFNHLSRGAPFFSLMVVGLAVLAYFDVPRSAVTLAEAEQASCETWDHEAIKGISALLHANSTAADVKLNEALAQLRRARMYCRPGSMNLARNDYDALHRAFPTATGSNRPAATNVQPAGLAATP